MEKDGIPYEVIFNHYYYDYYDDSDPNSDIDDYEQLENFKLNNIINEKSSEVSQVRFYKHLLERRSQNLLQGLSSAFKCARIKVRSVR